MEHIIEKGTISCFEQDLFEQERAQETIGRYRKQIAAFSEWIAEKPVTKDLVVQYKQLLVKSYSPASVNVALAALNGFFNLWVGKNARCDRFEYNADIMPSHNGN